MEEIETERLILRDFSADATAGLFRILANPYPACFYDEKVMSLEEAEASAIERGRQPDAEQVAVWLKEPREMIGYLFGRKEGHGAWSIGWNFAKKFQGKGFATEAARSYIHMLFHKMGVRRVCAFLSAANTKSRRVCERLGMRLEGCFKEYILFLKDSEGNEVYEDSLEYAILKKEWVKSQLFRGSPTANESMANGNSSVARVLSENGHADC